MRPEVGDVNNRFAFLPMQEANPDLGDPDALRARLDEDGYLYLRGVLDVGVLRYLRGKVLQVLSRHGWVEPPSIPISSRCLIAPLREDDAAYQAAYRDVQHLEELHALAHDPTLHGIMRDVVGETAFPHPLKVARIAFPDHFQATTPPHQDNPNNQGTPGLTAAWIPLHDLSPDLGGLAVLRGSHKWGRLPLERHMGAGNRSARIPDDMAESCRWVTTDFALGDVLVFGSMTVHAALHNASAFDLRLSVDFRYQPEGEPLSDIVLEPHFRCATWDEIYAGWTSTELQYYWRDLDFEVVPFADLPLADRDGDQISPNEIREIVRYQYQVEARTARRLAALEAAEP